MENDKPVEIEVAEILRLIEELRSSPLLSIEEKIEQAKRLVSIVEKGTLRREEQ